MILGLFKHALSGPVHRRQAFAFSGQVHRRREFVFSGPVHRRREFLFSGPVRHRRALVFSEPIHRQRLVALKEPFSTTEFGSRSFDRSPNFSLAVVLMTGVQTFLVWQSFV
jgi:hypothetical protein